MREGPEARPRARRRSGAELKRRAGADFLTPCDPCGARHCPEPDAERTAAGAAPPPSRVEAAALLRIEPIPMLCSAGPWSALVVTRANALVGLRRIRAMRLSGLRVFASPAHRRRGPRAAFSMWCAAGNVRELRSACASGQPRSAASIRRPGSQPRLRRRSRH